MLLSQRQALHARQASKSPGQALARRRSRGHVVVTQAFWKLLLPGSFGKPASPDPSAPGERPLYKPAELVPLGELQVSPMGLGTWSWGNRFLWGYDEKMDAELQVAACENAVGVVKEMGQIAIVQEVFNLVVKNGINVFDTADSYGTGRLNGKSELLLGQFIREYPGSDRVRDNIHIATKFAAYPWRVLPGNVVAACKGSLRRLGLQQLSVGQLHWSTANYQPLQELALQAGLADCYEQGLVRAVGVSNYGPKQLEKIYAYLDKRGVPLASAQIQFSLLSWGTAQQDLKSLCDDLGITVIAYSPLALGILTGKYSVEEGRLPEGPRGTLFKQLLPEVAPLVELVGEVARERGKTPSQVAINWCIAKGTVPIPGAKDLAQAKENLGALGWRLSEGEVAELDATAASLKKSMVQNIFQTQ